MRAATVTVTVLAAVYLLSFVNCDESVKKFKRNTMTQERKFFGDENSKTVQELILEFNQTGTHNLIREYDEISKKEPAGTFNSAKLPENIFKNRYAEDGLLSFDHSRVVLSKDENSTSDYINANFVDGYRHKNTFISTQGL